MSDKKVVIYSTPYCHFCTLAKKYLSDKGVAYTEHDVARDETAAEEMVKKTGQMGVPVIIIGNEIVVGFDRPLLDKLLAE